MMKKTKIIATIGPSSNNYKTIKNMVGAGLNVVRLNMSHGVREGHQVVVDIVKKLRQDLGVSLPIMMDNRGPEIRVLNFADGSVNIKKGQEFTFCGQNILGDSTRVSLNHPSIVKDVKVGDKILACNGLITFKITSIEGDNIHTKALSSGVLSNHKSLFLPNTRLNIEYLNEEDKKDIVWAIKNDIEYMACSFVNSAKDVESVKKYIKDNGGQIEIISKIESKQGVKNLDEIIKASEGIMVARGDLGVELPLQTLPSIQKQIIEKTRLAGKICITATEMLESMTQNPRPTRAETSDVANAVFDGTGAVMLSGETAAGKHPVEVVRVMSEIVSVAEKNCDFYKLFRHTNFPLTKCMSDVISYNTVSCSFNTNSKAIMVISDSGRSPRMISRFYPSTPIVAITDNAKVFQKLNMYRSIVPVYKDLPKQQLNDIICLCNDTAKEEKIAKVGETVIIASASRYNDIDTDFIKLHIVK